MSDERARAARRDRIRRILGKLEPAPAPAIRLIGPSGRVYLVPADQPELAGELIEDAGFRRAAEGTDELPA